MRWLASWTLTPAAWVSGTTTGATNAAVPAIAVARRRRLWRVVGDIEDLKNDMARTPWALRCPASLWGRPGRRVVKPAISRPTWRSTDRRRNSDVRGEGDRRPQHGRSGPPRQMESAPVSAGAGLLTEGVGPLRRRWLLPRGTSSRSAQDRSVHPPVRTSPGWRDTRHWAPVRLQTDRRANPTPVSGSPTRRPSLRREWR